MSMAGDLSLDRVFIAEREARDALVKLMGSRQADSLIARLYAAGFKITPIKGAE